MEVKPKIKWVSLVITAIASLNTIAIAAGTYHLSNEALQNVDLVVSAIGDVAGTYLSHRAFTK